MGRENGEFLHANFSPTVPAVLTVLSDMYTSRMQDQYREAASMLLLRPAEGEGYELLLLHKPRKKDAWQLPQGGVEGNETPEECAVRELNEEAGLGSVMVLGKSETVYQYDFPASYRRFRPDHICGQRIRFVFAHTDRSSEVIVDAKEVDRYEWIKLTELPRFIKRKEYVELVQSLYKEALQLMV